MKKEFNTQIKDSVDQYFDEDPSTRGNALDAFQLLVIIFLCFFYFKKLMRLNDLVYIFLLNIVIATNIY